MGNLNSKKCITCNELSPADFNKCQYCGSELIELPDNIYSDMNLKISIGRIDENEPRTKDSFQEDGPRTYMEEEADQVETVMEDEQMKFNDIFGFKSDNHVIKEEPKTKNISNRKKVFLTIICSIIPGLGQLFCLILSLSYINTEDNEDIKSFGQALFVAALVMFVFSCIISFLIALAIYQPPI